MADRLLVIALAAERVRMTDFDLVEAATWAPALQLNVLLMGGPSILPSCTIYTSQHSLITSPPSRPVTSENFLCRSISAGNPVPIWGSENGMSGRRSPSKPSSAQNDPPKSQNQTPANG
ncbi:uncharacterized protein L203_102281 [Cryptococcus depauperatus CBS 7841]|uniref:Uncharacterized protein n=1 Tax=Cryptococcus depauperatus CBS 7841 TaxID=1295531 RepID=A0AAJ8M067_9TREE